MKMSSVPLSETARTVLGLIAEGRSYDQILQQHADLTYLDIFAAAREALDLRTAPVPAESVHQVPARKRKHEIIERAREKHPRAYERWTGDEDQRLALLFAEGMQLTEIARTLERQRRAIISRPLKLGLITRVVEEEPATDRMAPDSEGVAEPEESRHPSQSRLPCPVGRRFATACSSIETDVETGFR
jgi:hypothetical protein